jgi:rSAM/selenodomain-associated transferase 1
MTKKILVVMAKEPRAGKAKTRLCPPLSKKQAAELYECFLIDKMAALDTIGKRQKDIEFVLAFDPSTALEFFKGFAPSWLRLVPQTGKDLGQRLINLFRRYFEQGFDQVVIADSDSPTLPAEFLQESFQILDQVDLVIGPTQDGGYYLIGLKTEHPCIFENISWSTDRVLEQTIRLGEEERLAIGFLPRWYDVDTSADLKRLRCALSEEGREKQEIPMATKDFLEGLAKTPLNHDQKDPAE